MADIKDKFSLCTHLNFKILFNKYIFAYNQKKKMFNLLSYQIPCKNSYLDLLSLSGLSLGHGDVQLRLA